MVISVESSKAGSERMASEEFIMAIRKAEVADDDEEQAFLAWRNAGSTTNYSASVALTCKANVPSLAWASVGKRKGGQQASELRTTFRLSGGLQSIQKSMAMKANAR